MNLHPFCATTPIYQPDTQTTLRYAMFDCRLQRVSENDKIRCALFELNGADAGLLFLSVARISSHFDTTDAAG